MSNKQESFIITSIENGIQKIIINRPAKKNSLTIQMYKDIIKILNDSSSDKAVNALVITGNGDFYSSGNDFIGSISDESFSPDKSIDTVRDFVATLILYPKLLIAIVNGPAIGIAATTLALFDIVYASETAYFHTPFSILGLSPEGCSSYTFPRIMGVSKASEILYLGEKLSAKEALQIRFVSKVYKSNAMNEIWTYLYKISSLSAESLAATKRLLRRWNKNLLLEVNIEETSELKNISSSQYFIDRLSKLMASKSKL